MSLLDTISDKLKQELAAEHVEIIDNTWQHAGHAGAAGGASHLRITLVSPQFEETPLLQQHRLVHQVLKTEMANDIHALELVTYSPSAWAKKQQAVH